MAFYYFIVGCVSFVMDEINLNLFIGHLYFFLLKMTSLYCLPIFLLEYLALFLNAVRCFYKEKVFVLYITQKYSF